MTVVLNKKGNYEMWRCISATPRTDAFYKACCDNNYDCRSCRISKLFTGLSDNDRYGSEIDFCSGKRLILIEEENVG